MFLPYQKLLDACEEQNVDAYTDSVSACYLLPACSQRFCSSKFKNPAEVSVL